VAQRFWRQHSSPQDAQARAEGRADSGAARACRRAGRWGLRPPAPRPGGAAWRRTFQLGASTEYLATSSPVRNSEKSGPAGEAAGGWTGGRAGSPLARRCAQQAARRAQQQRCAEAQLQPGSAGPTHPARACGAAPRGHPGRRCSPPRQLACGRRRRARRVRGGDCRSGGRRCCCCCCWPAGPGRPRAAASPRLPLPLLRWRGRWPGK
jgi:hypothetical protein